MATNREKPILIDELNKEKKLDKKEFSKICKKYSISKSQLFALLSFTDKFRNLFNF